MTSLWVYAEAYEGAFRKAAYELLGKAAQLARAAQGQVTAVVMGSISASQAAELGAYGADRVLLCEDASLAPPRDLIHAQTLATLCRQEQPDVLLIPATGFGRSLAPCVAAMLDTGLTADCTKLEMGADGLLQQTRPAFGGHLMATIVCPEQRPQMATVRPKVFPIPTPDATRKATVEAFAASSRKCPVTLAALLPQSEGASISDADVIVAVGAGIGSDENLRMAEKLAHLLGGVLAASRPVVDAGRVPYPRQVGQTGKTVAPKLYLALGISGAIQHMAGVDAERIIAVNTDPDAPIFAACDEAVVADCGSFLRELLARMEGDDDTVPLCKSTT